MFIPQNLLVLASELSTDDQASVEFWLSNITAVIAVLVVCILALALLVRVYAKRSTQPCPWCMEFISKKETVCPRCGKPMAGSTKDEVRRTQ